MGPRRLRHLESRCRARRAQYAGEVPLEDAGAASSGDEWDFEDDKDDYYMHAQE